MSRLGAPARVRERVRGTWPVARAMAELRRGLPRALASDRPLIAGPWLSEVGFEVLYWIPLLRWFCERNGIDPARVTALSRGGAEPWYDGIAGGYVDAFDVVTPEEVRAAAVERARRTGGQKHFDVDAFDTRLTGAAARMRGLEDPVVLHPRVMYDLFRWTWGERPRLSLVDDHTSYRPFARPELPDRLYGDNYVAVKAYFSDCFPDTDANRRLVSRLIGGLATTSHVVLLSTPTRIDEHSDYTVGDANGVFDAADRMNARDNLAVQTAIVAGARALVCTYGGFSYLGPHLGVPTVALFSERNFNPLHVLQMRHAEDELARHSHTPRLILLGDDELALVESLVSGHIAAAK